MANKFTKDNLRNTFSAVFSQEQVNNINNLYNYLKDTLKWSDRNIAAVMGNVMQESSFNYGNVSSAGAVGAFQFLGDRLKDYNKWRIKNGYKDGALSQATYLDYIIQNRIDPRQDMVDNARKLLLNKNSVDSINANKVLSWAETQIQNGTFYPISDLSDRWGDETYSLDEMTDLWSNTIEKAHANEKNNTIRRDYANKLYNLIIKKNGGELNYYKFFK